MAFTGSDIALIITAVGTLISAVCGGATLLVGVLNNRGIAKVHDLTNSKMGELLTLTKTSATAEGHLAGRADQKADDAAEPPKAT